MARHHKPRRRFAGGYILMPLTAFVIFCIITILLRTGAGAFFEQKIADLSENHSMVAAVLSLVMPAGNKKSVQPDIVEQLPPEELEETAGGGDQPTIAESVMPEAQIKQAPAEALNQTESEAITVSGEHSKEYSGGGTVYIKNQTKFKIDTEKLLSTPLSFKLGENGIQVLIMHTHGSEAYTQDAENQYVASDLDRTIDERYSVIRVGEEITQVLREHGIDTLHSAVLNDYPAYSGSYNRALADIKAYTQSNPSIKVVIDVHRDAMIAANGTKYKTVATINGKQTAQLMFVAGTNGGGLSHDNWKGNLSFQLKLQDRMNTKYPGIMRPLDIRNGRYNQHMTPGSMLIEVGTSGNTLPEAIYSAHLFAEQLAELFGK